MRLSSCVVLGKGHLTTTHVIGLLNVKVPQMIIQLSKIEMGSWDPKNLSKQINNGNASLQQCENPLLSPKLL